jgi:hypothetical protein
MLSTPRVVQALRAFLVLLCVVLVPFETLSLPGQFAYMADQHPEDADLRWPLTAVTVFWVVCIQVVVLCTWKLLALVEADRIFSEVSFRWVNAIIGAIAAAGAVLLGVFLVVGFSADDPGILVLLFLLLVGVTVLALLMVVMRGLLRQATLLRTDLDAVI